ncbi:DUF305 domain-containing protein [Methylovirgula sp. 4M-Z18]|nr:DUF305 domain-containing protein [Methylovirgula sp. 4M-Z18]
MPSLALAASLGFAISPLCGWAQDQPQNPQTPQAAKPTHAAIAAEAPFLAENNTAMDKMMAGMEVKPTGDVDVDFAAMMIPHHQGAIDMALAELRYGRNERLRRIAQEIVVEQQQEIVAMHLALGQPLPTETASPTQVAPVPVTSTHDHASMSNGDMTMPDPNPTK